MNTQQLLDQVFKDPRAKHYLDLFAQQEKNRLQMFEKKGKVRIRCMVRDRDFVARPEEVVRQLVLIHLHYTLGYPIDQLAVEVPVHMGSAVHEKAADVVVYRDPQKLILYIIAEVKKPRRKDGREQLHSYMNATGAPYGWWTNGRETSYELRTEPNLFGDLRRLPRVDETLDDVREPIRKHMLKPVEDVEGIGDLIDLVERLQEEVLANAGVNVFEEVFKLFFAKLWDEESTTDNPASPRSVCRFRVTVQPPEEQMKRFQQLLDEAIENHPGIFPKGTTWGLSPEAMVVVVSVLEPIRLSDTDMELMDHVFEYLLAPESKGDKGQYFTPRQVIKMAVKMLNPRHNERVLDPACGPCGFLIQTLLRIRDTYFRIEFPRNWSTKLQNYGKVHLYAVDFDPRVERVARFMMWVAGDGGANVFRMNSLDEREWKRDPRFLREVAAGGFDVIMTNPPFAGTIRHPEILTRYDLAYKERLVRRPTKETVEVHRDRKRQNSMTRDVLFLERCLRWLKPGGRLAIVLPQGNFNNVGAEPTRREIMRRARILAVVGLHVNTFKPHTGTKTSVLFLQRWDEEQQMEWEEWYQATYDHETAVDAYRRRVAMRDKLVEQKKPIPSELSELKSPGDPPAPPWDYPIFFATSKRSGRDNGGRYDYLKDEHGQVVKELKQVLAHDAEGAWVEMERERDKLNCDLDEIAEAFIAWGREQSPVFFAPSPGGLLPWREVAEGAEIEVTSVQFSRLTGALRVDAEHYQREYLELGHFLDKLAKKVEVKKLEELVSVPVRTGSTPQHREPKGDDTDVLFIKTDDLREGRIQAENADRLPLEAHLKKANSALQAGDVIVTIIGATYDIIGRAAMVFPDLGAANINQNIALIRPQDCVASGYLAAFLNTAKGRTQLWGLSRQTEQVNLNCREVEQVRVPLFTEEQRKVIHNLVIEANRYLTKSHDFYRQAEQLLLDELGLSDQDLSDDLWNDAKLTAVLGKARLDAEHYQAKYRQLETVITSYGSSTVGELLACPPAKGQQQDVEPYQDGYAPYVSIKDIYDYVLVPNRYIPLGKAPLPFCAQPNDLLLAITGATLGKVGVNFDIPALYYSGDLLRLRFKEIAPLYVAVFLRSPIGQDLIWQYQTGSTNRHLAPDDAAKIPVPRLQPTQERAIANNVRESYAARVKCIQILEQAKHKVEAIIESEVARG